MNVRLIAVSAPVGVAECATPGDLIAYCARVSNPANQANTETAPRLLRYLVKNAHWSPFEMAHMVVEIVTTRDIARQILRHRSFSFQEFSQRYAVAATKPTLRECRLQDPKNRQASNETEDRHLQAYWEAAQRNIMDAAVREYEYALRRGIAKEVARAVLPEGLTESTLFMAGTVRSWVHYVELRTDPSTQKEHRQIALACRDILFEQFPALSDVLQES